MTISTERAFDLLPHAVAILEELELQAVGARLLAETRQTQPELAGEALQMAVGLAVIQHVLRHAAEVKDEFFALVAAATGTDIKTAKARPLAEQLQLLREIWLDPELMSFFRSAVP